MATRSIVPRATGEGGIGTALKHWLAGYFDSIYAPVKHYEAIPASKFRVPLASSSQYETDELSNGIVRTRFRLTAGGSYVAYARVDLPDDWNGGNMYLRVKWSTDDTNLNGISLPVYGVLIGDGDDEDVAVTDLVTTITDTNTGAGKENMSAWTSAFTMTGSAKRTIVLKIGRGSDALASYVDLLEVDFECIRQLA